MIDIEKITDSSTVCDLCGEVVATFTRLQIDDDGRPREYCGDCMAELGRILKKVKEWNLRNEP